MIGVCLSDFFSSFLLIFMFYKNHKRTTPCSLVWHLFRVVAVHLFMNLRFLHVSTLLHHGGHYRIRQVATTLTSEFVGVLSENRDPLLMCMRDEFYQHSEIPIAILLVLFIKYLTEAFILKV